MVVCTINHYNVVNDNIDNIMLSMVVCTINHYNVHGMYNYNVHGMYVPGWVSTPPRGPGGGAKRVMFWWIPTPLRCKDHPLFRPI